MCTWATAYADATVPEAQPAAQAEMQREPAVKVKAVSGGVEIDNAEAEPCAVVVVALTGQVAARAEAPSGVSTIDLRPGYYIVRAGTVTAKVAVR